MPLTAHLSRATHSSRAAQHGTSVDTCSDVPEMAAALPEVTGDFGTKVTALIRRLKWIEANSPGDKSLVFSSYQVTRGGQKGRGPPVSGKH